MIQAMPTTIAHCLQQASQILKPGSDSAHLDAELLLAHVLKKDRVYLYTWPEETVSATSHTYFLELVERRANGEPIAYITGIQEFWSLPLKVTPDTLIPRPDTEILVQEALNRLKEDVHYAIADLGSGSGAIALAIASERPCCHIQGVDQSKRAVEVATENALQLKLSNISFQQGDWLSGFADDSMNMILSNPPYVADDDPHMSEGDVRFEPTSALLSGPEGLDDYKRILPEAMRCLKEDGWLLLEHGYNQQEKLLKLMQQHGFKETKGVRDYGGQARVIIGHI